VLRQFAPLVLLILIAGVVHAADDQNSENKKDELRLEDCPRAVEKTFKRQAKGASIESVRRDEENDSYLTDVTIKDHKYGIEVASDGTLIEKWMENEEEAVVAFSKCPKAVRKALADEADGIEIEEVERDVQNGVVSYIADVKLPDGYYSITVAKDGTLIDKNRDEDQGEDGPDAPKAKPQGV